MEKTYGNGNAARGIAAPAGYAMNPDTYLYFAYGSNMNPERIRQRIPEARPVGRATLRGWRIVESSRARSFTASTSARATPRCTTASRSSSTPS